jgi:hypothetical protein
VRHASSTLPTVARTRSRACDRSTPAIRRAAREQPADLVRELTLEVRVLDGTPLAFSLTTPQAGILVDEALRFGLFECRLLD